MLQQSPQMGAPITASKYIRILFGLPIATGCHSFTLRPIWLCVPAFQQVCPIFSFAARTILTEFFLYCKNNFNFLHNKCKRGTALCAMPPEPIFFDEINGWSCTAGRMPCKPGNPVPLCPYRMHSMLPDGRSPLPEHYACIPEF